jgi:dTDP-glucose pyrophosphorylase
MTVIITMAGAGSRFRNAGFETEKFRIKARGRTLFEWAIRSLKDFYDQHFIFACLEEHDGHWIGQNASALGIRDYCVQSRPTISLGQAQTAFDALDTTQRYVGPLWIYNIDTYVEKGISPSDISGCQACAHVFRSKNPAMSYVKYNSDGYVSEIAEKRMISDWATVGVYGFESVELFKQLYHKAYIKGEIQEIKGERYVAPMYQLLIEEGKFVHAPKLELNDVHILGTPAEVRIFDPDVVPPNGSGSLGINDLQEHTNK